MALNTPVLQKLLALFREEREQIRAIYFYAILNGLVALVLPLGTQAIISFVVGGVVSASLVLLITLVVSATLVTGILQVNQKKVIEKIEQRIFVRYSFLYAYTIPKLDLRSTQQYYLPELTNRFFDTVILQKSFAKLLLDIPGATIQIIFGLILLSFYNPVFIVFGILLVSVLALILRLTAKKGVQTSIEESNYKYQVAGFLEELARNPAVFKFNWKNFLPIRRTDALTSGYLTQRTAHFKVLLTQYWALIIFKVCITLAMLLVGSGLLLQQKLNIGQFVATELVIIMVIYSVEKLIASLEIVYDMATAADKVTKLLEKPLEKEGSFKLPENNGISIEMNHLDFSYLGEKAILKDINIAIRAGEKVVISGATGSGKSTLLRVISGLLQPTEGVLLYNDVPYREYDLDSLRISIGTVFETTEIFEGTLAENLTFGDEARQQVALRGLATMLHMQDFIFSNPKGLQQEIPMAGYGLSPRTKKKIMLLRALLNSPSLLVIEYPEQFLDTLEIEGLLRYMTENLSHTTCIISSTSPVLLQSQMRVLNMGEQLATR